MDEDYFLDPNINYNVPQSGIPTYSNTYGLGTAGNSGVKRDNTRYTAVDRIGIQGMPVSDLNTSMMGRRWQIGGLTGGEGINNVDTSAQSLIGKSAGGVGSKLSNMDPVSKMSMIGGLANIAGGIVGSRKRKDEQIAAADEYKKMREAYQNLDTSNIYADVQNQYANLENTMEDLTVNQQQAQFEAQQGAQSRANIMQNLQGAAGGSGIAALAQAMANQSQLATQRAGASIGMQESRNQVMSAQQAARVQMAERGGEARAEQMRLAGAESARGLEWQKAGTLLGMAQERKFAADQARAQATQQLMGGIGQLAGGAITGGLF